MVEISLDDIDKSESKILIGFDCGEVSLSVGFSVAEAKKLIEILVEGLSDLTERVKK